MTTSRLGQLTTPLIYCGTFLLSVLSFFTTLNGLSIFLSYPLALTGSLGLQLAMLGIAWNLIRMRGNRLPYITVFLAAAIFSIFFSYANFNISLKAETRATDVRSNYAIASQPILDKCSNLSESARLIYEYRVERISDLINREENNGWATIVDEGSGDPFIQSVIDGARIMVTSWRESQGVDYRQGAGRGIIVEYLESHQRQTQKRLYEINDYAKLLNTLGLSFSGDLPVTEQYDMVNKARVEFPTELIASLDESGVFIPRPPSKSEYIEFPSGQDQAFMLIIGDLKRMDGLTIFSITLAIAIDLIVMLMALAGSYSFGEEEQLLERIRREASRRIREIRTDDLSVLSETLKENIALYETAGRYGIEIKKTLDSFQDSGQSTKVVLPGRLEPDHSRANVNIDKPRVIEKSERKRIVI